MTAVDELYVEQAADGAVLKQVARVRLFFLGFLSGTCTACMCPGVDMPALAWLAHTMC